MDIHDVRQQNLQQLLDERFDGKQVRLAELIDRQAGYLSRCLSKGKHRKRIGEDFARHIEQSLELESGWMDKTSDLNSEAAGHRADFAARLKEALSSAGIEEWGAGARLAKMAKVTPKAASKWMNGETRPGHEKLVLIAAQLGVRAEWLDYGNDPMTGTMVGDAYSAGPKIGDATVGRSNDEPTHSAAEHKASWLAALASPRSQQALERIAQAAREGRLTEQDLMLLETIADKIAAQSAPDEDSNDNTPHARLKKNLGNHDPSTDT